VQTHSVRLGGTSVATHPHLQQAFAELLQLGTQAARRVCWLSAVALFAEARLPRGTPNPTAFGAALASFGDADGLEQGEGVVLSQDDTQVVVSVQTTTLGETPRHCLATSAPTALPSPHSADQLQVVTSTQQPDCHTETNYAALSKVRTCDRALGTTSGCAFSKLPPSSLSSGSR
jgi:hypothetical protein